MRNPHRMLGIFGVISTGVGFICALYTVTAILGYITYGSELKGSITLNLSDDPLDFSVKVMLLLMTYCGYLIQHYPIFQTIWPLMQRRLSTMPKCISLIANYTTRYATVEVNQLHALSMRVADTVRATTSPNNQSSLKPSSRLPPQPTRPHLSCSVTLTDIFLFLSVLNYFVLVLLACSIPNLAEIIPIIGVTTGMLLAFVFPAVLESVVFWDQWRERGYFVLILYNAFNAVYILAGIFFLVLGVYANVEHIINS
ncbi:hypothetical protein COOONC_12002 [Cooperia oncophora]